MALIFPECRLFCQRSLDRSPRPDCPVCQPASYFCQLCEFVCQDHCVLLHPLRHRPRLYKHGKHPQLCTVPVMGNLHTQLFSSELLFLLPHSPFYHVPFPWKGHGQHVAIKLRVGGGTMPKYLSCDRVTRFIKVILLGSEQVYIRV